MRQLILVTSLVTVCLFGHLDRGGHEQEEPSLKAELRHEFVTRAAKPLVISHVTVIDGTGAPPQDDMTAVIVGDRITQVDEAAKVQIPIGSQVVEGRGKFLIAGLWDMHAHLSWVRASALSILIANGLTWVRDMGGRLSEIDEWRTKILAGLLVGPRIVRSGPQLNGQEFNPYQLVSGNPDETRGVVRALKKVGVDFIKIHRRLPRDSYFAAIDEAKRQGLPLVGHIPMTVSPAEASDAGQATIEHTETLFEGTFSAALKDKNLSDAIQEWRTAGEGEKLFARFVKNRTVVTPALGGWRWLIDFSDPSLPPDPRSRYVAESMKKAYPRPLKTSAEELTESKRRFAEFCEVVRGMNRSGVTLLVGTDAAGPRIPGFSLHDELETLVHCGLTPMQALQAATLTPAKVFNKAGDFGTVGSGKFADLVLLDANPLEDIRHTQRIRAGVVNGRFLDRKELDGLLAEGEAMAKTQ
jgi:imidazolonepropionase-like amidohydrolase